MTTCSFKINIEEIASTVIEKVQIAELKKSRDKS